MKKLIILIVILFTSTIYSQEYNREGVRIAIDWQNALWGSDVNPPALDLKVTYFDDFNGMPEVRVIVEYEHFDYIKYYQGSIGAQYMIPTYCNFIIGVGGMIGATFRDTDYSRGYFINYIGNLDVSYYINDWLGVGIQAEYEIRNDISQFGVFSTYGGIEIYF